MRRFLSLLLILSLAAALFTGCGGASPSSNTNDGKLQVAVTVFPAYDWLWEIAGDHVDLTLLADGGVDLHSYQPSVDDMVKISSCDLAVYVGGESDAWVAEALQTAPDPGPQAISLMEALGDAVKEEALVEGMESEDEEDGDEPEYDEHVWLSLKNAETLCKILAQRLGELDPDNRDAYAANASAYLKKLQALDDRYADAASKGSRNTLLFGDRFPFRYMTDDYGLTYYAAFSGCSAETEASFETIVFLAGKVDELGLPVILRIETSDGSIAKTVSENTNTKDQKILTLNSMQAATSADSYLSIMEDNLEVLKQALS